MPLKKYIPLIIEASLKDGFWITFFFLIIVMMFKNETVVNNPLQLSTFIILCLVFSFIDEKISLKMKRWEYSEEMPLLFGVGVSPLLELAITGILTFAYIFLM